MRRSKHGRIAHGALLIAALAEVPVADAGTVEGGRMDEMPADSGDDVNAMAPGAAEESPELLFEGFEIVVSSHASIVAINNSGAARIDLRFPASVRESADLVYGR